MRRMLKLLAVYLSGCLCATAAVISWRGNLAQGNPNEGLLWEMQVLLPDYHPMGVLDEGGAPAGVSLAANDGLYPSLAESDCRTITGDGCLVRCCNYDLAAGAEPVGLYGNDISGGAIPVPEPSARTSLILVATVVLIWLWRHFSPTR
jgi:hypothetical protein